MKVNNEAGGKLMSIEEMRQHEWDVSWSGGKDSTATILLMRKYDIPIKQITYVRMMYDDTLAATLPVMTDFVDRSVDKLTGWGYKVNIVKGKRTAIGEASRRYQKSKCAEKNGYCYGMMAFCRGKCQFTSVKQAAISSMQTTKEAYRMLGYAVDETDRTHRLGGHSQSIMVACGMPEQAAYRMCSDAAMLSPLYAMTVGRDGCWFCPNAGKHERAIIKREYPELYKKIIELIAMAPPSWVWCTPDPANNWVTDFRAICKAKYFMG